MGYSKLAGLETLLAKKIDKNTGQIPSKSYDNLNDYTESGIYNYVATNGVVYNRPSGDYGYGVLIIFGASDFSAQVIIEDDFAGSIFTRTYFKGRWQAWRKITTEPA